MAERPLTTRQREVLRVILASVAHHGFPPTLREIGLACGVSISTAHQHLACLAEKGYIVRDPRKQRAIRVLRREQEPELA